LEFLSDVFCSEDGHAQVRSLLPEVLETVERGDVWIAERNFASTGFLFGLHEKRAFFVIRRHAKRACEEVGSLRFCAAVEGGEVYAQAVAVHGEEVGRILRLRQGVMRLEKPTRDGGQELRILTSLPAEAAAAATVAELYRKGRGIEGCFMR
jgi:hypothetical protein